MKNALKMILLAAAVSAGAAEFDYDGTFTNGMDGWDCSSKKSITEIKDKKSGKTEIRLDGRKQDNGILVYSRMYGSGMSGDKVKLQATAYGKGFGYIGVLCLDKNGNQTGIPRCYFRLDKKPKTYSFEIVLPESTRKDPKGNLLITSKTRVIFGTGKGSEATFSEVHAESVK